MSLAADNTIPIDDKLNPQKTATRYHYLDNLRAFAMLAGVLFHVALAHGALTQELWPTADTRVSIIVDYITGIMHTFRMPLFFLVAGFFAHYLVIKYGLKGFLKNRGLRILLPFIIFWPLVTAAIIGTFVYAALHMEVNTPIINMIRLSFENPEAMQGHQPPPSTTHLWFIYYLSLFCVLTAIAYRVIPTIPKAYQLITSPLAFLLILPLITGFALLGSFIPHPAPESFIPQLWAVVLYGSFFLFGWAFYSQQDLLSNIEKFRYPLAASTVVFSTIFLVYLPEPIKFEDALKFLSGQPEINTPQIIKAFMASILAWHISCLCLWAAYKWMNWQNAILRYITDSSYWVYIMHIPVVFALQAYFHTIELPIIIEFTLMSFITLSLGFISYTLLVRRTPIGWLLNGKKRKTTV